MMDVRTFANSPTSVKQARRFVSEQLTQVADDIADAVILMVSELTTNSIRHANVGFTVTVNVTSDEVRVVVADSGPGSPELLSPSPSEPHGRGLQIVTELSDDWGFTTSASTGTSVWFTVRLLGDHRAVDSNVLSSRGVADQSVVVAEPSPSPGTSVAVGSGTASEVGVRFVPGSTRVVPSVGASPVPTWSVTVVTG